MKTEFTYKGFEIERDFIKCGYVVRDDEGCYGIYPTLPAAKKYIDKLLSGIIEE